MQPNALLQACLLACFEVPSIQAPHPHGVEQGTPPLSRVCCVNTSVPGAAGLGPGAVPLSTSLRGTGGIWSSGSRLREYLRSLEGAGWGL